MHSHLTYSKTSTLGDFGQESCLIYNSTIFTIRTAFTLRISLRSIDLIMTFNIICFAKPRLYLKFHQYHTSFFISLGNYLDQTAEPDTLSETVNIFWLITCCWIGMRNSVKLNLHSVYFTEYHWMDWKQTNWSRKQILMDTNSLLIYNYWLFCKKQRIALVR